MISRENFPRISLSGTALVPLLLMTLLTTIPVLSGCVTTSTPNSGNLVIDPSAMVFGVFWTSNQGRYDMDSQIASRSGLTVVVLDSEAAPGRADVIVRLSFSRNATEVLIETFSARTRKPLTTGRASYWTMGTVYDGVAKHLMDEFAPQKELYKRLAEEKDGGKGKTGAAAAGGLLPESGTMSSASQVIGKPVQSDREFAETSAAYRAAFPKPQITEQVRRLKLQAEVMIDEKLFIDAARLYNEALNLAPWWPDGRFNRALLLGELKRYGEAITEMNRFLQLEENAPEARPARDYIYRWEAAGKVGQGGRQ